MASVKGNIILNLINTLTGIIFPIITFPYAARIICPDGIGIINFQQSIINYIVLFTSLGIPLYAVREVARCRENITERNKTVLEIILLSFFLSILGYIAVFILATSYDRISNNAGPFYILSLTILFTAIGAEWFYKAIEDFKYITYRAIAIRCILAALLFVIVKTKDDLLQYAIVVVGTSVGNNIFNFLHLRKFDLLKGIDWMSLAIFKHLKPALHIFVLNLIISLYTNLNMIMLGIMASDTSVGLYTAGTKLTSVVLGIVTSISAVLLPQFSYLFASGNIKEFRRLSQKSYNLIMCITIPSIIGLIAVAYQITMIFCGEGYENSISVLVLTAPTICFIALTNLLGIQILYPQGKENIVIYSTIAGAFVNIGLNIVLIPIYAEVGAAISTMITELSVLVVQVIVGKKYISINYLSLGVKTYILGSLLMIPAVFLVLQYVHNNLLSLALSTIIGGIIYILFVLCRKDEIAVSICDTLKNVLNKVKI